MIDQTDERVARTPGLAESVERLPRRKLSIVLDLRFPGGTAAAVARELHAITETADVTVYGIETEMFKGRQINSNLERSLSELGLEVNWNPRLIRDEFVVFHNPACLKFNRTLDLKIVCDQAYIVTHENFLRPNGGEGFDVGSCLALLEQSLLARSRFLAPVSDYNRNNIETWLSAYRRPTRLRVAPYNWFNVCDFELVRPSAFPRDRRGRLSRPGFEKFPSMEVMKAHFPSHAEACVILGGDSFLLEPARCPGHWEIFPFGSVPVDEFLQRIDFFVYFTHPLLRESFGRVIPEAIAAGKLVITDAGIAKTFGEAVVVASGKHDVDKIIEEFVEHPARYREFVLRAQSSLAKYSSDAFLFNLFANFENGEERIDDLL